ncbi:DUF4065 domain-containing protein [Streptomyces sp. NP160]|uniref:Panacea domain-containing protein n=1 Tax=Streptomyces sp. NP160 TaxID=2586637 RepID=UPI001119092C|nr:type II toxin-antitoxin system antitoxin SocA domain-containing protein [Streptomyces sp. NP160]TNM66868.1 DUF4065 domain-containing protein [Streptomyces sp. NP160]
MSKVDDVAAYIIERKGPMTAMKLQKLVYYSHAWHLVWEEAPLFPDTIEAWANGPVVRHLYDQHRGNFQVADWPSGEPERLDHDERESIEAVLEYYGKRSAHDLSELTHSEDPWKRARAGLGAGVRSSAPITDESMFEYYDGLTRSGA